MISLQPPSEAPWGDRFEDVATAIDTAANENPVFGTPERTAAVLTSVAFFESHFNPDALGDCTKGRPRTLATCQSVGAFQISKAHASAEVLVDPLSAARQALRLMGTSVNICRARPLSERLGWYAWGRVGCYHSLDKSRHRMALAATLLRAMEID